MPASRNAGATRRRKRQQGEFTAAFPGRKARLHKARWLAARDRLAELHPRGRTARCLQALLDRVALRPHLRTVLIGFGGIKDRAHRERLAREEAEGRPSPTKGLAELSGMSRSSMVRARRDLVQELQLVRVIPGRGRGNANGYELVLDQDDELERRPAAAEPPPRGDDPGRRRAAQETIAAWKATRGP